MGKKCSQDESYAYVSMKKFLAMESRVAALEELLTKPKGTKDGTDKQTVTEKPEGSGEVKPVSKDRSGSDAVQGERK